MDGNLPPDAIRAIEDCVRAVVREQSIAPDAERYEWARDYGSYGTVDLVVPPGEAAQWPGSATRVEQAPEDTYFVVVDMWTKQEGHSDLSLEMVLRRHDGQWHAGPKALHVL